MSKIEYWIDGFIIGLPLGIIIMGLGWLFS